MKHPGEYQLHASVSYPSMLYLPQHDPIKYTHMKRNVLWCYLRNGGNTTSRHDILQNINPSTWNVLCVLSYWSMGPHRATHKNYRLGSILLITHQHSILICLTLYYLHNQYSASNMYDDHCFLVKVLRRTFLANSKYTNLCNQIDIHTMCIL